MRLIAVTQSIEEAKRIEQNFKLQGYLTKIVEKRKGFLAIYEVWITKEGEFDISENTFK